MVALARRPERRHGVRELLKWVTLTHRRMNGWTWQYAPVAAATRAATYEALKFQDRAMWGSRGERPDPALLRAALAAFEAMPAEARDRVERGQDAGTYLPDDVRRLAWSMLCGMSKNTVDKTKLAEALCVSVGDATGVVDVELHGSDWAWGANGEEAAVMVYVRFGLDRGQVAAALAKVRDELCDRHWNDYSADRVTVDDETGQVKVMGQVVHRPGDGVKAIASGGDASFPACLVTENVRTSTKATDRRGTGKDAHSPRRKTAVADATTDELRAAVRARREVRRSMQKNRPAVPLFTQQQASESGEEAAERTGDLVLV